MKSILLPTDFSKNSWNAMTYAVQLFKDEACVFHILNVYTPPVYHIEYVLGCPEQFGFLDIARDASKRQLDKIVSKISATFALNKKHKFYTYARFDILISGMMEFIESNKVDLIVMGTKGATSAKELLFGSNTVHVFNNIKKPVLAIPSGFTFEKPQEVLFPTDLGIAFNHSNLKTLKEIVVLNRTRLHAMHVSKGGRISKIQEDNKKELESIFLNLLYLFHTIERKGVPEAIKEFQIQYKIDFLVMINNKHSFFENLFFKNTINQIGLHLDLPFLVIPSEL